MSKSDLKTTLENLPNSPGVYQFFDDQEQILYVGKSKNLKKRVNSYFDREPIYPRVKKLVSLIFRLEYFVTSSETEALILEANLIKTISPKYNVIFKDDKSYPYLKFTIQCKYPWVEKTYKQVNDGSLYFGPFTNGTMVYRLQRFLDKNYPLVKCRTDVFKYKKSLCLEYQIGNCLGPCELKIDEKYYQACVDEVRQILSGQVTKVSNRLKASMQEEAENLNFEKAAEYRDQIQALDMLTESQNAEEVSARNEDYFAIALDEGFFLIQHVLVREGRIVEQKKQFFASEDFQKTDLLLECISQRLMAISDPPRRVCLALEYSEDPRFQALIMAIAKEKNKKIDLFTPKIGRLKRILDMTSKNAQESLRLEIIKNDEKANILIEVKEVLGLAKIPYRIECFDISNISGTNPVASMVVCLHGQMVAKEYRKFSIKVKDTPDDYAMMREAVSRRYTRLKEEKQAMPDLIIIDGGLGHLHIAKAVLLNLDLKIPVVSLAEKEEIIFNLAEVPMQLGKFSKVRLLFQKIRDEAHRFAVSYHQLLRRKRTLHSILDEVLGIGKITRQKLLKAYPNINDLKKLSLEELKKIGLSEKISKALLAKLTENN